MRYTVRQRIDGEWKETFRTDFKDKAIKEASLLFRLRPQNRTIVVDTTRQNMVIKIFERALKIVLECNYFHLYAFRFTNSDRTEEAILNEMEDVIDEWRPETEFLAKWLRGKMNRPDYNPDEIRLAVSVYDGNIRLHFKEVVFVLKGDNSKWKRLGF